MIDYSVFMMGNPMDVDAAQKAYAKAQVSEIMPFSQFVKHIADHNGVFTRGTVKGVIADMCECLVEMLLEGKKVQLAELGNFWISIGSEGAEDLKKFTESNITAVNIVFTPGEDFQNLRSRATFNPVASRIAQAATLKAEKAGKGTVDLDAAFMACCKTKLLLRASGRAAPKKRCMNTPSNPYSCIHLKCRSTVLSSVEEKKRAVEPSASFWPVGYVFSYSLTSGHISIH